MPEYQRTVQAFLASVNDAMGHASPPDVVADVVWNAVTDGARTLRYTAGDDAREIVATRKALDDDAFIAGIRSQMGLQAN